jgi:muconolactone D-isomerase
MEFMVRIEVALPADQREAIVSAERKRGQELRGAGVLRRIWRIPGTTGNVGLWEAEDATALHAAIASLPAFPWAHVDVTALAEHPLEGGADA